MFRNRPEAIGAEAILDDVSMVSITFRSVFRLRYYGYPYPKPLTVREMLIAVNRYPKGDCRTELFVGDRRRATSSMRQPPGHPDREVLFESIVVPGDPAGIHPRCLPKEGLIN